MTTPANDGKNSPDGDATGGPATGHDSAETEPRIPAQGGAPAHGSPADPRPSDDAPADSPTAGSPAAGGKVPAQHRNLDENEHLPENGDLSDDENPLDGGTESAGGETSDRELIDAVRQGSTDAYAQLYERHVSAAYSMARQVSKSPGEADDLVSEAFVRVLDTMRGGNGPTTAFRAYLLTSLRNTAYDRSRRDRKIQLSEDVAEASPGQLSTPFTDPALAGLERSLVATAFARLPERWQAVLWHVEIENETPAQIAPVFGLTANGVSALAYRAREGLRQEYLQAHLGQLDGPHVTRCRATVERLGAWARGGLSKRENAQVETHLDGCGRCRELAAELADINGSLRVVIAPMVLGVSAIGYLTTSSHAVLGAAAGGAAAGGAGAGASAGAGAASSVPRQTVGMAASGTALAAAVALAVALTGDEPRPVAAPPPPPPAPAEPAKPVPPPPPKPSPPQAPPAKPQPAPPPPAVPNLTASGPTNPVELVAGGAPTDLPISVRNGGSGVSAPVTVTLELPQGVTADMAGAGPGGAGGAGEPAGSGGAGGASEPSGTTGEAGSAAGAASPRAMMTTPAATQPGSASPAAASPAAGGAPAGTRCENIPGGIRCSSTRGLAPGESHVFPFRLHADQNATNGAVTAHVMAGHNINLSVPAVPVTVRAPEDGVRLETSLWEGFPWLHSRLDLDVHNTGKTSGRAETVVKLPHGVHALGLPPECRILPVPHRELRCAANLKPGQEFEGTVFLKTPPRADDPGNFPATEAESPFRTATVPVVAKLGSATDEDAVELRHVEVPHWPWPPWFPPHMPDPDPLFPPDDPPTGWRPVPPEAPKPELPTPLPSVPHPSEPQTSQPRPSRPQPSVTQPPIPLPSVPRPSMPEPSALEPSAPEPSIPEPSGHQSPATAPSTPQLPTSDLFPLIPATTEHLPRGRAPVRPPATESAASDRPSSEDTAPSEAPATSSEPTEAPPRSTDPP